MSVSLTKAKAIARHPEAYTIEELDDALTVIVEDDRLTEAQVIRMQRSIDPVLRRRLAERAATCTHPAEHQSADLDTNEVLCHDCGWLRDAMPWEEWASRPTAAHLLPVQWPHMPRPPADGRPTAD